MTTLSTRERKVAADAFKSDVRKWADRIGVKPTEIRVRDMTRKWASCSENGVLTFDVDILTEPPELRAKVIVHELVHLKVPNHGPLFRSLLRAHLASIDQKNTT